VNVRGNFPENKCTLNHSTIANRFRKREAGRCSRIRSAHARSQYHYKRKKMLMYEICWFKSKNLNLNLKLFLFYSKNIIKINKGILKLRVYNIICWCFEIIYIYIFFYNYIYIKSQISLKKNEKKLEIDKMLQIWYHKIPYHSSYNI